MPGSEVFKPGPADIICVGAPPSDFTSSALERLNSYSQTSDETEKLSSLLNRRETFGD